MTIYFVTSGAWGSGTGSPLAAAQVDGNFYDVDQRIVGLTADLAEGKKIDFVDYTESSFTIHYTDATTQTIPLPVLQLQYVGSWMPTTPYTVGNLFTESSSHGFYQVLQDHTSAGSFDPSATSGGNPLYALWMPLFDTLDSLNDVVISSVAAGDTIIWNGTGWVNQTAADISLIDDLLLNDIGSKTGTFTLDLSLPESIRFTMSNNCTIAGFTWPTGSSGKLIRRVIEVVNGGSFTLTWPSASKWPGGVKPTQSTSATDVYIIFTSNAGSTVFGNVIGQNYA